MLSARPGLVRRLTPMVCTKARVGCRSASTHSMWWGRNINQYQREDRSHAARTWQAKPISSNLRGLEAKDAGQNPTVFLDRTAHSEGKSMHSIRVVWSVQSDDRLSQGAGLTSGVSSCPLWSRPTWLHMEPADHTAQGAPCALSWPTHLCAGT